MGSSVYNPAPRSVHRSGVMSILDSNPLCLASQSDPHCLFSRLILALLPSAGGKFHKTGEGGGGCQPAPTTQTKGGGGARLIIHLFCPSSLSKSMLPSLFGPLSLTTFNFIHSLIPPLTHLPPQHPSHLTSPSHHHTCA